MGLHGVLFYCRTLLQVALNADQMAITGHRNALGDITKQQNLPKNAAAKDALGKVGTRRQTSRKLRLDKELAEVNEETERSRPSTVPDIDEKDLENPQLCAEYTVDVYSYLRNLEPSSTVKANHLLGCSINDKMRAVLVDWLVEVQVQFKLLQETLFSTISIVDRFLAIEGLAITRSKPQLVGVAAMFLASKVEEVYAPACSDFVYITDNAYTEDAIKQMEIKILQTLKFNLFEPLSLHFLRRFSKAGDVDVLQHSLAKYAIELALVEYDKYRGVKFMKVADLPELKGEALSRVASR